MYILAPFKSSIRIKSYQIWLLRRIITIIIWCCDRADVLVDGVRCAQRCCVVLCSSNPVSNLILSVIYLFICFFLSSIILYIWSGWEADNIGHLNVLIKHRKLSIQWHGIIENCFNTAPLHWYVSPAKLHGRQILYRHHMSCRWTCNESLFHIKGAFIWYRVKAICKHFAQLEA